MPLGLRVGEDTLCWGGTAGSADRPGPLLVAFLPYIAIQRKTPELTECQNPNECVRPEFGLSNIAGFPKMAVDRRLKIPRGEPERHAQPFGSFA